MQEIGPENLLNKHSDKNNDRMSKIMARAETLKKIHRQRTSKQREQLESSENNDDILDDDYLQKLTEKVTKKMKLATTSDNIKI